MPFQIAKIVVLVGLGIFFGNSLREQQALFYRCKHTRFSDSADSMAFNGQQCSVFCAAKENCVAYNITHDANVLTCNLFESGDSVISCNDTDIQQRDDAELHFRGMF